MTAINFGAMKTRVRKNLNNLAADHPIWVEYGLGGDFVNEAANRVIMLAVTSDRRAMNCFPELRDLRWDELTTVNTSRFQLGSTMLVLESATYTKLATAYDPTTQTEYPMIEMSDPFTFGLLSKSATGWPQLWRRAGNFFEYWPTSTASFLTRVVLRGLRKEAALTTDGQTFVVSDLWHPTIVKAATALGNEALERHESATKKWEEVTRDVTACLNLLGLERTQDHVRVDIAGMPR